MVCFDPVAVWLQVRHSYAIKRAMASQRATSKLVVPLSHNKRFKTDLHCVGFLCLTATLTQNNQLRSGSLKYK